MAARNSIRARKARSVKLSPTPRHKLTLSPAAMAKRLATRKRYTGKTSPADAVREFRDEASGDARPDVSEELFAILHALVRAIAVVRTAKRGLEHREDKWDEVVTLEIAIEMLRQVDESLNLVADGRPSRIRPVEADVEHDANDTTNDGEGDE